MTRLALPCPIIDTLSSLDESSIHAFKPDFATYDLASGIDFLKQYDGNNATFEAYRREIERLLQWSWLIAKKSILEITRHDIQAYIKFCLDPPKSWIGTKRVARFIERGGIRQANIRWRPFIATVSKQEHKLGKIPDKTNYRLSQKAIQEIFTVLSSFYNFLLLEEKVTNNPITLLRQKSRYIQKRQTKMPVKRLTDSQWQCCLKTAKQLAQENPERHERTLFIITILYMLYLRISELASSDRWTPQMNHFYQDSNEQWWFKTLGKGNKIRDIAVSDQMLTALKRYRSSMKLTALPSSSDARALVTREGGETALTSTRHIRHLVQVCFDKTVEQLRIDNLSDEANGLEQATVHWLRHTGISDDINKRNRPIAHVRDDAGHTNSAITDRYNDIELFQRHRTAKDKN